MTEKILFNYYIDDVDGNREVLEYWAQHLPDGMWVQLIATESDDLKVPEYEEKSNATTS